MPTQAIAKPASNRQLAYIRRLQAELGTDTIELSPEISSSEASTLIGELIARAQKNGSANGYNKQVKISEPRLGMAMKECFRKWKGNGYDIYGKHREAFVKDAINAYNLFTEIAQKVENGQLPGTEVSRQCH